MAKGILEFNLPEERNEHETAVKATALFSALWDLDQALRNVTKHGYWEQEGEQSEEVCNFADKVREHLYELIREYGLGELWG